MSINSWEWLELEVNAANLRTIITVIKEAKLTGADPEVVTKRLKVMYAEANEKLDLEFSKNHMYEMGIFIDTAVALLYDNAKRKS